MLTTTVLIPTYRRPQGLLTCLEALQKQTQVPNEVIIVVRDIDTETWKFLKNLSLKELPIKTVTVSLPGQVAALNAGLAAVTGDIVSITDDDAAPHQDWLARIAKHFLQDQKVGGVGGRDWVYENDSLLTGHSTVVGKIEFCGRVIGNHHIGSGGARCVEVLKGANMSYRTKAIENLKFDERLLGQGAQVHNDLAFSTSVKSRGWKLIYDSAVAVDHFPGKRFDEDERGNFSAVAKVNSAHNETLILLDYMSPLRRGIYLFWAFLIGTRTYPGMLQLIRLMLSRKANAVNKYIASTKGRWAGLKTWLSSRRHWEIKNS